MELTDDQATWLLIAFVVASAVAVGLVERRRIAAAWKWLARHLISDAGIWHKFWTIRIALFWGFVSGCFVALPAAFNYVHPAVYAALSIVMSMSLVVARLFNQPGIPKE